MSERLAGALILVVLAGIAGILVVQQLRWMEQAQLASAEAAAKELTPPEPVAPAPIATDGLARWLPGWQPQGPAERYDADRLFEKINGHAPLYLEAGFELLEAQRFVHPEREGHSMELRLYTLGTPADASSVRAASARPGGEAPAPELDGQCVEGACFLAHGRYLIEALPSPTGPEQAAASRAAVLAFAEATGTGAGSVPPSGTR